MLIGLAKNNQSVSFYRQEIDNQNREGLEFGVGLNFEIKKNGVFECGHYLAGRV